MKSYRPDIVYVRSDKDTHFTTTLATDAEEQENLSIAFDIQKGIIESLSLQSDQNLAWTVYFWAKDTFASTNLDTDTFIDFQVFAATDGERIAAANQYRYAASNLGITYRDDDRTGELHISLVNRSATSKNAGATGEVVIEVGMRPDLGV